MVQKKFTRILPQSEGISYKEGLDNLGLLSLESEIEWRPDRSEQICERHRQGKPSESFTKMEMSRTGEHHFKEKEEMFKGGFKSQVFYITI